MPYPAWNALFLLGSLNSLFLGVLLLNPKQEEHRKANRYLSVILFSWSFGFFYTWMIETGMYRSYPHLLLVGAPFTFLTGPCLYLYKESLLGGKHRNQGAISFWKRHLLHFAPFYLNTLALLPFYLQPGVEKLRYWEDIRGQDPLFAGMQVLQLFHLGGYLTVLLVRLREYRKNLGQTVSTLEGLTLDWLRNLILLGFLGLGVYGVVFAVFRVRMGEAVFVNRFTDLAVLVILHVLGYEALTQPAIAHGFWEGPEGEGQEESMSRDGAVEPMGASSVDSKGEGESRDGTAEPMSRTPTDRRGEGGAYARSSLSLEQGKAIARKAVEHLNATGAYLDENFSLRDLAMEISVPVHHLSQAINQHLQMNFFELVNRERVRHAKELLDRQVKETQTGSQGKSTFMDIAFASGFRSKSTFNALFKRYLGCTPTEYYRKQKDPKYT